MQRLPLEVRTLPQRALDVTPENQFWDSFELQSSKSHFGQIKHVHICPQPPHDIAISCMDQVAVYDGATYALLFRDMHFKAGVNCCQFRSDGQLFVASGNDPIVRVWSRNVGFVRLMRGHTAAVNYVAFCPNKVNVLSTSDDMTARIWDLATQETSAILTGHTDYVKAGGVHPTNDRILATGSYDRTLRIWDTRASEESCALVLHHPDPVEALAWHPSGNFVAAGAGDSLYVWDVVSNRVQRVTEPQSPPPAETSEIFGAAAVASAAASSGPRPAFTAANHQRAITTVAYDESGARLLTGALDDFVKVYATSTCTVVHSFAFSAGVQAVALSPDDRTLVVGMADGKVAIHARSTRLFRPKEKEEDDLFEAHGGFLFKPEPRHSWRRTVNAAPTAEDLRIESLRWRRLKPYDTHLVKFRYHRALDEAIEYEKSHRKKDPSEEPRLVVMTVLEELYRRNGLRIALHGRTDAELLPTLRFIERNILDPRYSATLTDVMEVILEIYAGVLSQSPKVEQYLTSILQKVRRQLRFLREMALVEGMVDGILASTAAQAARRERLLRQPADLSADSRVAVSA